MIIFIKTDGLPKPLLKMETNLTKMATSYINMMKIILLLCSVFCFQYSFAQMKSAKETILKFAKYKDEKKKLDSLLAYNFPPNVSNNPRAIIKFGQMILENSLKTNDLLLQGYSNNMIGTGYRGIGKSAISLSYLQTASDIAEKIGNTIFIANVKNNIGNVYKDRENWNAAL